MTDYGLGETYGFRSRSCALSPEGLAPAVAAAFRDAMLFEHRGGARPEAAMDLFGAWMRSKSPLEVLTREGGLGDDPLEWWVAEWLGEMDAEQLGWVGITVRDDRVTPQDTADRGWRCLLRLDDDPVRLTPQARLMRQLVLDDGTMALMGRTRETPWTIVRRRMDGATIWCWYLHLSREDAYLALDGVLGWDVEYQSTCGLPMDLPLHRDAECAVGFSLMDGEAMGCWGDATMEDVLEAIENQVDRLTAAS